MSRWLITLMIAACGLLAGQAGVFSDLLSQAFENALEQADIESQPLPDDSDDACAGTVARAEDPPRGHAPEPLPRASTKSFSHAHLQPPVRAPPATLPIS